MGCRGLKVFVTGASSGIGAACAKAFAEKGADLLLWARREERLLALKKQLEQDHGVKVLALSLDVSQHDAVKNSLENLPEEWQAIDILVNNAGFALGLATVQEGNPADWDQMIDTNIKGLLYVTRYVLQGMLARQKGHIINIGSISGHQVYSGGTAYCATKFAVRAISEGLKMDVHGTPLRVTSIDPGMVETEFSTIRFAGDEARAKECYKDMTPLLAEDIADAVVYCATRPPHVDIREIKILPTDQTAAHLCHRQSGD